jgi:AraC-like DNA-binding protein
MVFAAYILSTFDICSEQGVELFATEPISLLYVTFIMFAMLSAAYFGRNYHKRLLVWLFLLQYPLVLLVVHAVVVLSGNYVKIYSLSDALTGSGLMLAVFMARMVWMGIMLSGYMLMTGLVIDSYFHFRKNLPQYTTENVLSMRRAEIIDIALYLVLFMWMMINSFVSSLLPRILTNIFMTVMIMRTYVVYSNFMHYSFELSKMHVLISKISDKLMEQSTDNPFYMSNPTLEGVAEALQVDKNEFRDYIYSELGTTLSAWTSEKRILYISQQLLKTDRMVSELAISCGYSNPSALNRAFKQRFGVTPSEFRTNHKS